MFIRSINALYNAFQKSRFASPDKQAWLETDMRAHKNPTLIPVDQVLAEPKYCPLCNP